MTARTGDRGAEVASERASVVPAVVAVFGGGPAPALGLAAAVARVLVAAGHAVLTGSDLDVPLEPRAVKDAAMAGAADQGRRGAAPAWRLGVARRPLPGPPRRTGADLLLTPGYGHARDYVEAHLGDAAVALDGGPGTRAEVACCLALGRPVLLVGPVWAGLRAAGAAEASRELHAAVDALLLGPSPWRDLVLEARRDLDDGLRSTWLHVCDGGDGPRVADGLQRLLAALDGVPRAGALPSPADVLGSGAAHREWTAALRAVSRPGPARRPRQG